MRGRIPTLLLAAWLPCSLLLSCQQPNHPTFVSDGVVVNGPDDATRLQRALDRLGAVDLSTEGAAELAKLGGTALVDRPGLLRELPADVTARPLTLEGETGALFLGSDEAALAAALQAQGVKSLILQSRAAPSLDRGKTVLSRLYNHDSLERFTLFRIGDGLLYYKILDEPVSFPPNVAATAIAYLRHRLAGGPRASFPDVDSQIGHWTLIATLRQGGRELNVAYAQNGTLQGALEELVEDLETDHRRNVELEGSPPLNAHIADLDLELQRVVERAYVEPRDEKVLGDLWEPGIDGFYMMTANRKERGALPGAVAYTRSITSLDQFLRHTAKQGRMSETRPWRDPAAWLQLLRTIHYADLKDQGLVFLYRGVPAIPTEAVSREAVRQAIVHAGDWYLRNMDAKGQIVYKFWPSDNRYSDEYNLVRHTLGTWNLVQAWTLAPERADLLEGARRALAFTERYLVHESAPGAPGRQMAYYSFNDNQKLGTVVVNMLGIIALARATQDSQWDAQLVEMGRFVQFMQESDGSFRGYHVPKGHAYYGQTNDIVPGEAALALITLADYLQDDQWMTGLDKYWEYYTPWFRSRAAKADWDAPWPAHSYDDQTRLDLVQFGPWTVMAANAYYQRTGDAAVADFGLEIARWMIEAYEWTGERSPWPDYVGGYYKLPHELPAMQAFCYAEGTAAAYQLALKARPADAPFFELATRETVRFGLQMQYDDLSTYPFPRAAQVDGGIRYSMNETKVRVDYVHHGLSAMVQWYEGAGMDPSLPDAIRNGPALPQQQLRLDARAAALAALPEGSPDPAVAYTGTRWQVHMGKISKPKNAAGSP